MQTHRLCTHYCKGGLQLNIFVHCAWQLNDGLPTVRKEIIFCGPTTENHKMNTYKKGSLSLTAKSDRIHQLHAVRQRVELNTLLQRELLRLLYGGSPCLQLAA